MRAADAGESSEDAVGEALAELAIEDGPPVIVKTAKAAVGAKKVSSLAGATLEVEGAGMVLPAGLEGGGTVVVVRYDEPPEFAENPEQEVAESGRRPSGAAS